MLSPIQNMLLVRAEGALLLSHVHADGAFTLVTRPDRVTVQHVLGQSASKAAVACVACQAAEYGVHSILEISDVVCPFWLTLVC